MKIVCFLSKPRNFFLLQRTSVVFSNYKKYRQFLVSFEHKKAYLNLMWQHFSVKWPSSDIILYKIYCTDDLIMVIWHKYVVTLNSYNFFVFEGSQKLSLLLSKSRDTSSLSSVWSIFCWFLFSGVWRRVARCKCTDVTDQSAAPVFRIESRLVGRVVTEYGSSHPTSPHLHIHDCENLKFHKCTFRVTLHTPCIISTKKSQLFCLILMLNCPTAVSWLRFWQFSGRCFVNICISTVISLCFCKALTLMDLNEVLIYEVNDLRSFHRT
jgi:hypothetical protein